jgi:N-acetylglucosaminyl-diphospho-decaprenol L-rhamnosyltransferase
VSLGDGRRGEPSVSAVVVSYNTRDELLRCLGSLDAGAGPAETIVVDNASRDGSAAATRRAFPAVRVIENADNLGFARATNLGLRAARGELALILNSDAEVRPETVATLARVLATRPGVAVLGPRTVSGDGAIQVSAGPHLRPLAEWRQRRLVRGVRRRDPAALRRAEAAFAREHEPSWVSGSCMMARRAALEQVGLFDEGYFLYEEDVDLCVRLRAAGWRVLYTPEAVVVHHLGRSMARDPYRARLEYERSHIRFYRKHNGWPAAAALRLAILATSALGWLRAFGPGPGHREERRHHRNVIRAALRPGPL